MAFALLGCYATYLGCCLPDLLGQPICCIFKCRVVEDSLTFEDGTDTLSRNVGKPTLPNILE
jgi:hypothetical protein